MKIENAKLELTRNCNFTGSRKRDSRRLKAMPMPGRFYSCRDDGGCCHVWTLLPSIR